MRSLRSQKKVVKCHIEVLQNSNSNQKETRYKLDGNEMKLYDDNKKIQLAETFDTKKAVANEIKEQIKHWGLKYIQVQNTPKAA